MKIIKFDNKNNGKLLHRSQHRISSKNGVTDRQICTFSPEQDSILTTWLNSPSSSFDEDEMVKSHHNDRRATLKPDHLLFRRTHYKQKLGATLIASFLTLFLCLATMFPGDPTLRYFNDSWCRFMVSPSGVSLGGYRYFQPRNWTSGKASPTWIHKIELQVEAERDTLGECLFYVHEHEPVLVLFDNGTISRHNLEEVFQTHIDELTCTIFVNSQDFQSRTIETDLAILSSATDLDSLRDYYPSLVNHQAYARYHGYSYVLSLVSATTDLRGRSGKYSKYVSLGRTLHSHPKLQMACHVDLDAWFDSWDSFETFSAHWPKDRDIIFGDTEQMWLNTGLICLRRTQWTLQFLDKVVNAAFHQQVHAEDGTVQSIGFKRDQPAVWHTLATEWSENQDNFSYLGEQCPGWKSCNPDGPPTECWQWCFWDALKQMDGYDGLASVNTLMQNIYLVPTSMPSSAVTLGDDSYDLPQFHRMCLRSCYSLLARATMGLCQSLIGPFSVEELCIPQHVDPGSMCDGDGCLEQMSQKGPAFVKHTGHQHYKDEVKRVILEHSRAKM